MDAVNYCLKQDIKSRDVDESGRSKYFPGNFASWLLLADCAKPNVLIFKVDFRHRIVLRPCGRSVSDLGYLLDAMLIGSDC